MKKENWNVSYAKLALEHPIGGVITSFLSCIGFCYVGNYIALNIFNVGELFGNFEQQSAIIVALTIVHFLMVPRLANPKN